MASKAKKATGSKKSGGQKKAAVSNAGKKPKKVTIEIFDPFGPGFRVLHKRGRERVPVGGAEAGVAEGSQAPKVVLDIFDPFGPGFRVIKKKSS